MAKFITETTCNKYKRADGEAVAGCEPRELVPGADAVPVPDDVDHVHGLAEAELVGEHGGAYCGDEEDLAGEGEGVCDVDVGWICVWRV